MLKQPVACISICFALILPTSAVLADPPYAPQVSPVVVIPRTSEKISVDGELDEPAWQAAIHLSGFTMFAPRQLEKPNASIEVKVIYDNDHLHIAFIAHDLPTAIRASLSQRDQIFSDDYVGVLLDPFGDASTYYEFFCNPLGIQGDLLASSNNEDMNFNAIYKTAARITDSGFQVEMGVPFGSLRFPSNSTSDWKINFWWNRPRDDREQITWSAIDDNKSGFASQFGTAQGIRDVSPGSSFELLPTFVGYQSSALSDYSQPQNSWRNSPADGEFSFGARYAINSSLSAAGTINPDFSQVESDATQIDVNSAYTIFYPEKRSFFQEGSDLFSSYFNAVYTRSLNDPLFAGKLTGRAGSARFIYLTALDEHSPFIFPYAESNDIALGGRTWSNLFRARQSFKNESHLGILATNRLWDGGGMGSVFSVDGSYHWQKYLVSGQFIASNIDEPFSAGPSAGLTETFGKKHYTALFDGENIWGHGATISASRSSYHFNVESWYREKSSTFRTDNGFVTANNNREIGLWSAYTFRPNKKIVRRIQPSISTGKIFRYDSGERMENWFRPQYSINLPGQTSVYGGGFLINDELYGGKDFRNIRRWDANASTAFTPRLRANVSWERGKWIARGALEMGFGNSFYASATVKPSQRMSIEPNYQFFELRNAETQALFFTGYILRIKSSYQINRELSARLITQYDQYSKAVNIEPLLTYLVNPLTVFYLGSAHGYQEFPSSQIGANPEYSQTSRQFFVKLQYLIRP